VKKGWILAGCSTLLLASMMTQAQEATQQSVSSQDTVQPITGGNPPRAGSDATALE